MTRHGRLAFGLFVAFLLVLLVIGAVAKASAAELPDAPKPQVHVSSSSSSSSSESAFGAAAGVNAVTKTGNFFLRTATKTGSEIKRHSFPLVIAASVGATVYDYESTVALLHRCSTCVESGLIFSQHPSRAELYGKGMPITVGVDLFSIWVKRKYRSNAAYVLPAITTAVHTGAGVHNSLLRN